MKDLVDLRPILLLKLQTSRDDIFAVSTDVDIAGKRNAIELKSFHFLEDGLGADGISVGRGAKDHAEEDDSQRPYIAFVGVFRIG